MTYVQYIWILLSILVAVTCSFCFLQPEWYVHPNYVNAFGIYAFCLKTAYTMSPSRTCGFYGGRYGFGNIPVTAWQIACLLYGGGCLFMCIGALLSLATMCVRTGLDKTLMLTTRYVQISSVLLMTMGLIVFPLGLDSEYFRYHCGTTADVYKAGNCWLGWAYILAITGNALSVFCPILSYFSVDTTTDLNMYGYKL